MDSGRSRLIRDSGRDKEYLDIVIKFTIDMVKDSTIITMVPLSMKMTLGVISYVPFVSPSIVDDV